jgi:hypothetical protein
MKMYQCIHGAGRRYVGALVLALFLFPLVPTESSAVSVFGSGMEVKKIPAIFRADDLWFLDRGGEKIIPDINLEWIAVVFRTSVQSAHPAGQGTQPQVSHQERAQGLLARFDDMRDFFCDDNLAENTCFFRLQKGLTKEKLLNLIRNLDNEEAVDYAHPTINIKGKTFAYFNAIEVKWKTGVRQEQQEGLLKQARVTFDEKEKLYRVDIVEIPFFKALNLLAEDIRVLEGSPYLVEVKLSIQATLALQIHGGNIGDKIPFTFTLAFSDKVRIDPSSIANIYLKPENIQKELFEIQVDPYDYVKALSASPIRITGWMRFYAPGDFMVPPLRVKYTCSSCSHSQERSLGTEGVPVKIASLVPFKQAQNTLIIPPDPVIPEYNDQSYHTSAARNLIRSLLCYLFALLLTGLSVVQVYRLRKQGEPSVEKRREEILAEKVKELLRTTPTVSHWEYVEEAGSLFRQYLVEKYGIPKDPYGGSGEVYFESVKKRLPEQLSATIHVLLKEIDTVIARELDPYPGLDRFKHEMMKIMD